MSGVLLKGTDRDEMWDQIFRPLAVASRRITIVDRYLSKALQSSAAGVAEGRAPRRSHVTWLLDRIHTGGDPERTVKVSIVTGVDQKDSPDDSAGLESAFTAAWSPTGEGRIKTVELVAGYWPRPAGSAPDQRGRRQAPQADVQLPHDRHISFDVACAIEIPAGIDRFHRPPAAEDVSVIYRWLPDGMDKVRDAEDAVRAHNKTGIRLVRYGR